MVYTHFFFSYIWKKWLELSIGEGWEFVIIVNTKEYSVDVWLGLIGSSKFKSVGSAVVLFIKKLN